MVEWVREEGDKREEGRGQSHGDRDGNGDDGGDEEDSSEQSKEKRDQEVREMGREGEAGAGIIQAFSNDTLLSPSASPPPPPLLSLSVSPSSSVSPPPSEMQVPNNAARGLVRSQSFSDLGGILESRSQGSREINAQVRNSPFPYSSNQHNALSPSSTALFSSPTSPSSLPLSSVTLSSDDDSFLFQPVPLGQKIQCKIVRKKHSVGSLYPQYELYLEGTNGSRFFLMSARRRKKTKGAKYLISLNRFETGAFDQRIVGKVKSNFLGTLFSISDARREDGQRYEQAAVVYEPNLLGLKGPRKLTLLLPGLTLEGRIRSLPYASKFNSGKVTEILVMRNKSPQWNEETQSYVLNFHNRVSQASVKNFQVVPEFDLDYIVMQFGRVGIDTFTMDFQYPLSALQAFAITLTSFDPKLACE